MVDVGRVRGHSQLPLSGEPLGPKGVGSSSYSVGMKRSDPTNTSVSLSVLKVVTGYHYHNEEGEPQYLWYPLRKSCYSVILKRVIPHSHLRITSRLREWMLVAITSG